ncbi:transglutaminase-like domain-containing protein [Nonomuraea pusilla]|uniref:Transglutaminase-like superfamily protein n=1 Tax=Nonomuraea pusilla TaxID=46177 RepID=A0A1H7YPJ9_9ACTN|nr:transglutaminase family protein [Nonomuraea pusilla]SEM47119.1 Transglutaminase-like superfamily protein [Nonomuraea pusilla]
MDLSAYRGRGFPGDIDHAIATTPVAGLDLVQARGQLRLARETEPLLYAFPPPPLRYEPGARPALERVVAGLPAGGGRAFARAANRWVHEHVTHPHHLPERTPPDRALIEEEIIGSGAGWCNEQARVLVALAAVRGVTGRLCFAVHANLRCGHTAAELFVDGGWAFFDPTFAVSVELADGRLAEARELAGAARAAADRAYREPLAAYYGRCRPHVEEFPGWRAADRPAVDEGGLLYTHLGFTDYLVTGARAS